MDIESEGNQLMDSLSYHRWIIIGNTKFHLYYSDIYIDICNVATKTNKKPPIHTNKLEKIISE